MSMTNDQIIELALRIQAENEIEALKLLMDALKNSYFEGWDDCQKTAVQLVSQKIKELR